MKGARSILFSLTVGFAVLAPPWTYLDSGHIGAAYAASFVNGTVTLAGVFAPTANSYARAVTARAPGCASMATAIMAATPTVYGS